MSGEGRVLALSTAAFTLLFAVWLMLGVLAVPIQKELGLTPIQQTWLTAIAILSGSIFRLPFGVITDRFGGRRVFALLTLISAMPCYLFAHVATFEQALICALCFGIAGNSFTVGVAWNAAWFPRERQGVALGTFGAGNVGASITKLLGPILIALVPASGYVGGLVPGGWRFVPVLYSVLLVAMAIVLYRYTPTPDRMPAANRSMASLIAPLRETRVWRFGLYYVVVFGAYVALSLWLPSYYVRVHGFSLTTAAMLTALFIFPASLLRPLGGWLSDRFGARGVTYVVFALMTVSCIPLALPRGELGFEVGPWTFFMLIELVGVAMGVGKASVLKYVPDYYPKDVGLVGGLVGTLGALGGFFLPIGFGYLEGATAKPEACFWVLLALVVLSFAWLHSVVTSIKRGSLSQPPAIGHELGI
jgi:NNP family nitrate/nitrite transporter-like MFS transporter